MTYDWLFWSCFYPFPYTSLNVEQTLTRLDSSDSLDKYIPAVSWQENFQTHQLLVCPRFLNIQIYESGQEKTCFLHMRKLRRRLVPLFSLQIVQPLYFLYPKYPASNHLVWLYSPISVRHGRKSKRKTF